VSAGIRGSIGSDPMLPENALAWATMWRPFRPIGTKSNFFNTLGSTRGSGKLPDPRRVSLSTDYGLIHPLPPVFRPLTLPG
jgi:hypothetical protein